VVGFYVEPFTVKHKFANNQFWDGEDVRTAPPLSTCDKSGPMVFESIGDKQEVKPGRVLFTYDVMWRASNVKWASRWDIYLTMDNAVPDKVCPTRWRRQRKQKRAIALRTPCTRRAPILLGGLAVPLAHLAALDPPFRCTGSPSSTRCSSSSSCR